MASRPTNRSSASLSCFNELRRATLHCNSLSAIAPLGNDKFEVDGFAIGATEAN